MSNRAIKAISIRDRFNNPPSADLLYYALLLVSGIVGWRSGVSDTAATAIRGTSYVIGGVVPKAERRV